MTEFEDGSEHLSKKEASITERSIPTFGEFVQSQSTRDKTLEHLARFLTGQYPPDSTALEWTASQEIDVIVCDISYNGLQCTLKTVRDLASLEAACLPDDPKHDVNIRLFLVEDMTIPVVETLGTTFNCHPQVFAEHMQTFNDREETHFDDLGTPLPRSKNRKYLAIDNIGLTRPKTQSRNDFHFSLAFKRYCHYVSEEAREAHEAKRTMPRLYDKYENELEERISGVVYEPSNFQCMVGIFLFDSFGDLNIDTVLEPEIENVSARYGPQLLTERQGCLSTREAYLHQLQQSAFIGYAREDDSILLCPILKMLLHQWLRIGDRIDDDLDDEGSIEINNFGNDNWMISELMESTQRCKDNLRLIKAAQNLINAGGVQSLRCMTNTKAREVLDDLKENYDDLAQTMEQNVFNYRRLITTFASVRSINESEKAIQQSRTIGALTTLATVYIPLSFVASVLGMNVTAISSDRTPLWLYFAIAVPLAIVSLAIVGYWQIAVNAFERFSKKLDSAWWKRFWS